MTNLQRINLAIAAFADRLFIASHTVTQEAINKTPVEHQQAIAKSFNTGQPVYWYQWSSKKEKEKKE